MITVKATRQSQPDAQTTREDFAVDESDKRRWVPVAFLLFLVGCAAYLKSFLPAGLAAPQELQPPHAPNDAAEDPIPADTTGTIGAEQEDVTGSVGDEKSADATPEPAEGGAVRFHTTGAAPPAGISTVSALPVATLGESSTLAVTFIGLFDPLRSVNMPPNVSPVRTSCGTPA